MDLHKGDRIEIIDEAIKGKVLKVKGNTVFMETDDGFEIQIAMQEVMKIDDTSFLKITNADIHNALNEKSQGVKRKKVSLKQEKAAPPMEVDLHIHQLTPSTKGMGNFDMLALQLDTAKRQLEFAIKNRIQRVVFIHGVGEGVLRTELEYLFGRYDNITFYDADYRKYGLGATEIYIYQNPT